MAVSFQFKDKETKKAISIARIDNEIASFEGVTPDREHAFMFDKYGFIGIAILIRHGGCIIDEGGLEMFLANSEENFSGLERDCMRKFFLEDYEFHAWR